MTICLRVHHLLCMLTYAGDGYSRAFTTNFDAVIARIGAGDEILIVAGPDDVCVPRLDEPDAHCLRDSVRERDALAARDLTDLLETSIFEGQRLTLGASEFRIMREAFASGSTRAACVGCEWHGLCSRLARAGFRDARLAPPS